MDSAEINNKCAAPAINDDIMLARIFAIDMKSMEVKYHHTC